MDCKLLLVLFPWIYSHPVCVQAAIEARSHLPVWYRTGDVIFLFDPFDPYFIRQALTWGEGKTILGHLIWGSEERFLISGKEALFDDPLSVYYEMRGEFAC
jgi:hypothetical protein